MTDLSFSGRRVVVTGAATGVGAALLDLLGELGAPDVTVLDVKAPTGPHATFLPTDLADPAAVDAAVAQIDGPVDALFNNAGVADTLPPETVFRVNVLAPLQLTEALLPQMPDGAAVAITASIAGLNWRQRLEPILELLALDGWDARFGWFDGRELGVDTYSFTKEVMQVWTMRVVQALDGAGCAHQQRVSGADRHAAARRLPQDPERRRDRLHDQPRRRSTGRAARGRLRARMARQQGVVVRQRSEHQHRRRLRGLDDHRAARHVVSAPAVAARAAEGEAMAIRDLGPAGRRREGQRPRPGLLRRPLGCVPVVARGGPGLLGSGPAALGDLPVRRHHRGRGRWRALLVVCRVRPHIDQRADQSIINMDDPDHQRQRNLVSRRFTPRSSSQPRSARAGDLSRHPRRRRAARRVRGHRGHRVATTGDHDRRPAGLRERGLGTGPALVGADHAARGPDLARRSAAREASRDRPRDPGLHRRHDPGDRGTARRTS